MQNDYEEYQESVRNSVDQVLSDEQPMQRLTSIMECDEPPLSRFGDSVLTSIVSNQNQDKVVSFPASASWIESNEV